MKFRLIHKLLIVLAVPVVFQLVLFGGLSSVLHRVDQHQEFEQRATKALLVRDRLYILFYQRVILAVIYRSTHDEQYRAKCDQLNEQVNQDMKAVNELWAHDSRRGAALKEIWLSNKSFSYLLYLMMNYWDGTNITTLFGGARGMDLMRSAVDHSDDSSIELMVNDLHIQQAKEDAQLVSVIHSVNRILIFAIIISVIVSVACGIFFTRSITERLKKVLMNIRGMERRQKIIKVLGNAGDEIAQLDRAIADTARQIQEAEEFQSQTAQLVAHELERPLAVVSDSFEELQSNGFEELNTKGMARLNSINGEIDRLQSLVDEMMVLDAVRSAGYDLKISTIDLSETARSAIDVVAEFARSRNIEIHCDAPDDTSVQADPERALQVAVNLLSNAIKFSPEGSRIEVTVRRDSEFGILSVKDEGPGIPTEFQPRIFKRFEQASSNATESGSSGLGLAICKQLIEAQLGRMGFETEVGKGSTFWFSAPLTQAETAGETSKRQPVTVVDERVETAWHPRLRRQALALIALPLVVQLISISALCYVLNTGENNLAEITRVRKVIEIHTDIVREVVKSVFLAMMFNATQSKSDRMVAQEEVDTLDSLVRELKRVASGDAVLERNADSLTSMIEQIETMRDELMDAPQDANLDRWFGPKVAAKNENVLTQMLGPLEATLQHQNELLESRALARREFRQNIEQLLLASVLVTAAVSVGMGVFLVRRLTRRVDHLVSNTVHLQKREPLEPPMPGDDELAFVDSAFYSAANRLMELERFKQELMSFTSHELRTPLTSILAFSDLVGTGILGRLSVRGEELLRLARRNVIELISMITNLLDSEKMQSGKVLVTPTTVDLSTVATNVTKRVSELSDEKKILLDMNVSDAEIRADADRLVQAMIAILSDLAENSTVIVEDIRDETSVKLRITAMNSRESGTARERLSMSLSQLIAQQHGGKFTVDSSNQRQVFVFDLPSE